MQITNSAGDVITVGEKNGKPYSDWNKDGVNDFDQDGDANGVMDGYEYTQYGLYDGVDPGDDSSSGSGAQTSPDTLPDVLTAGGVQTTAGGQYVDKDGYKLDVKVTLYKPVILTGDDSDALDGVCAGLGDDDSLSDQIAAIPEKANGFADGVQEDGAMAVAFKLTYTSPDAKFPFPLDTYLTDSSGNAIVSHLNLTTNPVDVNDARVSVSCTTKSDGGDATMIGFGTLLPPATATPKNPDQKLSACAATADVEDSIGGQVKNDTYSSDTAKAPSDPRLTSNAAGIEVWSFPVSASAFAGRCMTRN